MTVKRQADFDVLIRNLALFGTVVCEYYLAHPDPTVSLWTVEVRDYLGKGREPEEEEETRKSKLVACGVHPNIEEAAIDCMSSLLHKLGTKQLVKPGGEG